MAHRDQKGTLSSARREVSSSFATRAHKRKKLNRARQQLGSSAAPSPGLFSPRKPCNLFRSLVHADANPDPITALVLRFGRGQDEREEARGCELGQHDELLTVASAPSCTAPAFRSMSWREIQGERKE